MKKKKKTVNTLSIILLLAMAFALTLMVFLRLRLGAELLPVVSENPEPSASVVVEPVVTQTPEPVEPTPSEEPIVLEPTYYTLSVIGDCTLVSFNGGNDYSDKMNGDYAYPFSGTIQYFENDDFTIGNLECNFSDNSLYSGRTFSFRAPTSYANILVEGGVDYVTTANNHFDDFGEQGIADTFAALEAVGMPYGKERETSLITTESGLIIGIYCDFSLFEPTVENTVNGIKSLKEQGAEYIICALHWGYEGTYHPAQYQIDLAHAAIDAGADLIYGSHAHVLQKTEEYNGGYILYSMGNWSFGGNTNPRDKDTAIIQITVKRDADGVTISNDDMTIIPCALSGSTDYNDYRPVPLSEDDERYQRVLAKLNDTWNGADLNIDYSAFH